MFCVQAPVVIGSGSRSRGGNGFRRPARRVLDRRASTRSASVVSCSVRTIATRTRVHSSFVGQTWAVAVGLARAHDRAVGRLRDALDRRDRSLQRLDDLGHRDLRGRAREQVAAARAAPRVDQPGLAQARDEVLQVGERQPVVLGDLRQRDRTPSPPLAARSSTITRTPYSALVENIIWSNTYLRARVSAGLELADVVGEAIRGSAVRLEQDPLPALAVEQENRGEAVESSPAGAGGGDA